MDAYGPSLVGDGRLWAGTCRIIVFLLFFVLVALMWDRTRWKLLSWDAQGLVVTRLF